MRSRVPSTARTMREAARDAALDRRSLVVSLPTIAAGQPHVAALRSDLPATYTTGGVTVETPNLADAALMAPPKGGATFQVEDGNVLIYVGGVEIANGTGISSYSPLDIFAFSYGVAADPWRPAYRASGPGRLLSVLLTVVDDYSTLSADSWLMELGVRDAERAVRVFARETLTAVLSSGTWEAYSDQGGVTLEPGDEIVTRFVASGNPPALVNPALTLVLSGA